MPSPAGNRPAFLLERDRLEIFAPNAPPDLASLCMDLLRRDPEARPKEQEIFARLGIEQEASRYIGQNLHR